MSRFQASFLLLLAALLWGSGNVVQQTLLQYMGPLTTNGMRCLIAAIAVMPFCWRSDKTTLPIDRAGKWLGAALIVCFTAATATLQIAYGHTTVTNAGFLANTSTILTPVLAWLVLRDVPRPIVFPAAALAFTGICLLGGGWPNSFSWGDSLCLLAAAFFALWMVLQCRFVTRYGCAAPLTVVQFLGCGAICLVLGLLTEAEPHLNSSRAILQLTYSGLIATAGGYLLLAIGQRYASASEAAIIISAEAVFGACFAHVLLEENHTLFEFSGAAMIIVAILLIELPMKKFAFGIYQRVLPLLTGDRAVHARWMATSPHDTR